MLSRHCFSLLILSMTKSRQTIFFFVTNGCVLNCIVVRSVLSDINQQVSKYLNLSVFHLLHCSRNRRPEIGMLISSIYGRITFTQRPPCTFSEVIAPQLFKIQRPCAGMETKPKRQSPPLREDIINELEQFSVEVLQAALQILQMRQAQEQE